MKERLTAEVSNVESQTRLANANAELSELDQPAAKAAADIWEYLATASIDELAEAGEEGPSIGHFVRMLFMMMMRKP